MATVAILTADVSRPVPLWAEPARQDITQYVRKDPAYPLPIGCGSSGEVHMGLFEWTDGRTLQVISQRVVVKFLMGTVDGQNKAYERVMREVATWRDLNHPNVCKFLGVAWMNPGRAPGLVSPYLQRNDFLAYLGRHPEVKLQKAREVVHGLAYLHTNGIIHGDLHVDNVLISDQGVAQINDFGMSRIVDIQGFSTKLMLNIRYNAPELMPLEEIPYEIRPTFQSDIFSLGMLILQVLHGPDKDLQSGLPYNHIRLRKKDVIDTRLLKLIHNGDRPHRERYHHIEDRHWDLLCSCWETEPNARPNAAYVMSVL